MTVKFSPPIFNPGTHVSDLNSEFSVLIDQLGINNRCGSQRYRFEVDFAYALNEVEMCPTYLQRKMFDDARSIVNQLSASLKAREKPAITL